MALKVLLHGVLFYFVTDKKATQAKAALPGISSLV
jgi:hypothetical protein